MRLEKMSISKIAARITSKVERSKSIKFKALKNDACNVKLRKETLHQTNLFTLNILIQLTHAEIFGVITFN